MCEFRKGFVFLQYFFYLKPIYIQPHLEIEKKRLDF